VILIAQLDDQAAPVEAARTATELRDTADGLDVFAEGYELVVKFVRPGDYPAGAKGWWRDGTQDDPRFEALVATLAAFELPAPATQVALVTTEYSSRTYETWTIESLLHVDDATADAFRGALTDTAAAQGVSIESWIEITREFPGQ
jgi:hypothetical protein